MNYPGGKNGAGVYQAIINQIPPHRVYIEAFAGSAAIYRHKLPARTSYLIDLDPDVNLVLAATPPLRDPRGHSVDDGRNNGRCFGRARAGIGVGAAGRGTRQNRRCGPAPLGKTADGDVICVHADARSWLERFPWSGEEFVYLDPPYLFETRRGGHHRPIYRCELGYRSEHARLLAVVKRIPAPVMISGYRSALYESELKAWRTLAFRTSTRGGPAVEVLWMNYAEPVALHDYSYLGENFRQRQDFKRMRERWARKLAAMPILKRQALTAAVLQ